MPVFKEGEGWMADFYEDGQVGRRVRKAGFSSRTAALRYETDFITLRQLTGCPLDERLSDLVLLWYERLGHSLVDHQSRLLHTLGLVERLNDPLVVDFDERAWNRYRASRLKVAAQGRVECERHSLSEVFADLIRSGEWIGKSPFSET
ncbi:hypothetical protein NG726_24560 [Pseudomonas sp. MOB-449]|nr:hypothetical protein [Pseudomonas sp. MOB-449]